MKTSRGLKAQLLKALFGTSLLRIISLGSTFLGSVVLARALGPESFGTYSFVFAIITLLAFPAQVGIPTLLVRETASAQAQKEWARLKGLWVWSGRVIIITSLAISLIAIVVVSVRPMLLEDELRTTLIAGLVLVPLVALGSARAAALRGLRLVVRGQFPDAVIRPVLLLLFVLIAWQMTGAMSAGEAMLWHVGAAAVAFLVGAVLLWRARPADINSVRPDCTAAPEWWRAVLPLALMSGLQVVSNQTGIVFLGILRTEAEVAMFKVATSAATFMTFGLQITNVILSPHIARLHALQNRPRLAQLAGFGALGGTTLTLPLFLIFVFAGEPLLSLVYGSDYAAAFAPLTILAGAQVVNAAFGSTGMLLSMTGHERYAARWLAVSATVNIVLSLILIPAFGVVGAAWASGLSVVIWNVAFWFLVKKKLGIDSSVISVFKWWSNEKT